MSKIKKTYGLWSSPISPEMIGDSLKFNDVQWDSDSQTIVWSESRGKRKVIVAKTGSDAIRDLTDSSYSPSGRVGYGGGSFTVHHGIVYFADKGRLFKVSLSGGVPQAITPKFGNAAALKVSPNGKYLTYVHTYEDKDVLAIVDTEGEQWGQKIASGDDFVMQPAWSPTGDKIAYIAWNHPQMPWNGTELKVVSLMYGEARTMPHVVSTETLIGDTQTAIAQPEFSPDGRYLSYISDATGWNHLYLYDLQTGKHQQITSGDIEHGIPHWVQGNHTYGLTGDGAAIYYIRHENGYYSVWAYDVDNRASIELHSLEAYSHFDRIAVSEDDEKLALIAASPTIPTRIITYSSQDGLQIARRSTTEAIMGEQLSNCSAIQWAGHDGEDVHGLYFAPHNLGYESDGKPPLMVLVHGGPTSQRNATFDMEVQFFTSRGFAVLQVNHRGSTGYGKAYMDKHEGNWGIYDVQDSITGAKFLAEKGYADSEKVIIMGGSAGGYTALQALVDAPNFFKAAVVSYGVANQFSLTMDTHKFEARYSEWLLGSLPEATEKYRDRSPIFNAKNIQDAVIIFQGTEDKVVPKQQSESIVAALNKNNIPHEYVIYEGEGHGFSKPETKVDFYNKVMRFLVEYVIFA